MAITLIRSNPALFRAMGIPSDEALAFTDPLNTEAGGDGFIADEETGYVDLSLQLDDYDSGKFAESPATAFLERLLDPLNRIARATPTDIVEELEREARLSPFVLAPFAVMPPVPAAIFAGAEIAAMSAASDTPANDDPPPVTDPSPAPSPATSLPSEYRAWLEAVIAEKLQLTFTNKSMQAAIKRLLGDYLGIRDREASEKMPPSEPQAIVELVMLAASERTGRRRSELHPFEKQLALLISALTRHMARLFFDDARLDPMASAHFPGYDAMAKASKDTITPEHFMAIIERNLPKGGPKKVAIIGPSKVEIDLVFEKWPKAQIVLIDSNKEKMAQIAAHYSLDPRVTAYAGLVSGGELPKDIHADLVISNFALPLEFAWSLGTEGIVAPGGVVLIQCQEFGNAPLEASVSGHKITEGFELLADQFGKPLFRTNISDRAYPIGVRAVALKAQPEGLGFEEALMTILYRTRYRARPDASKIREMLVDEAGKKDESVDTEDKALRFWDQEAKARGYESLETYLMMRFGYMSATALPSQMRRHMIELADTTDTDSLAFREWDYVADRKDAIAAELEAEGKVAAEKIDKLAKIMAGIEFYNPEWKDKLEPDDFVDDILEPAPERAQELMDLSIVAAKDDFPELVVSPDMPAQDMIKRLTAFFTDYRDAERRYDSAALNNRHCCESAQRVVSILRGKGFKARMLSTFKENIGHWMAVVELGGREYVIDTDHHQFGYDDLMIVPIDDLSKFDISVSAIDIFFDTNALHNAQIHAEQLAIREYMRMLGLLPASGTSIPPIAGGAPAVGELGSKQQVEIAKIVQKDASKNMGVKGYDPRWAGKLVAEREEGITVDFGEGQERNLFIPHELLFSDLGKAISAMFEKYYQTDGRDECALGVITVDEEPRYVVVRGGFAVTPVGRPIMHTHPKGAYVLPTHGDTQKKYISKGETQYIYSVTNDGDEILTSYTKLNDEDVLLADIAQFKDDSKITKRFIIAADPKERHVIPLGEILSLISRAKHGVTTAEFKWGGDVIMLTVRMGEDGTVEGIDMRGGNGGIFKIPKESVRYLRPYDTPNSASAASSSEIKPPTDAELSELESALDIIYTAPDAAKRIYDNDRNLYSKVELLALARINPVEVRDLLYNLWANTIIDIRGAATAESADAYFKELEQAGDLNGPTQRTKALLDALDISPWLMMAFGTKPGFIEDIAKVRAGYDLYDKYVAGKAPISREEGSKTTPVVDVKLREFADAFNALQQALPSASELSNPDIREAALAKGREVIACLRNFLLDSGIDSLFGLGFPEGSLENVRIRLVRHTAGNIMNYLNADFEYLNDTPVENISGEILDEYDRYRVIKLEINNYERSIAKASDGAQVDVRIEKDIWEWLNMINPDSNFAQIIFNLITNVGKYRPESMAGKPSLRIHRVKSYVGTGENQKYNGLTALAFEDNAGGIPDEVSGKIGKEKVHGDKTKPGDGDGLLFSYQIIEKLGGKIWFDTVPGQGTTFYIHLPDFSKTDPQKAPPEGSKGEPQRFSRPERAGPAEEKPLPGMGDDGPKEGVGTQVGKAEAKRDPSGGNAAGIDGGAKKRPTLNGGTPLRDAARSGKLKDIRKEVLDANARFVRADTKKGSLIDGEMAHVSSSQLRGTEHLLLPFDQAKGKVVLSLGSGPDVFRPIFSFPLAAEYHLFDTLKSWGTFPQQALDQLFWRLRTLSANGEIKVLDNGFLGNVSGSTTTNRRLFAAFLREHPGERQPIVIEIPVKAGTETVIKRFYFHPQDYNDERGIWAIYNSTLSGKSVGAIMVTGVRWSMKTMDRWLKRLEDDSVMMIEGSVWGSSFDGQERLIPEMGRSLVYRNRKDARKDLTLKELDDRYRGKFTLQFGSPSRHGSTTPEIPKNDRLRLPMPILFRPRSKISQAKSDGATEDRPRESPPAASATSGSSGMSLPPIIEKRPTLNGGTPYIPRPSEVEARHGADGTIDPSPFAEKERRIEYAGQKWAGGGRAPEAGAGKRRDEEKLFKERLEEKILGVHSDARNPWIVPECLSGVIRALNKINRDRDWQERFLLTLASHESDFTVFNNLQAAIEAVGKTDWIKDKAATLDALANKSKSVSETFPQLQDLIPVISRLNGEASQRLALLMGLARARMGQSSYLTTSITALNKVTWPTEQKVRLLVEIAGKNRHALGDLPLGIEAVERVDWRVEHKIRLLSKLAEYGNPLSWAYAGLSAAIEAVDGMNWTIAHKIESLTIPAHIVWEEGKHPTHEYEAIPIVLRDMEGTDYNSENLGDKFIEAAAALDLFELSLEAKGNTGENQDVERLVPRYRSLAGSIVSDVAKAELNLFIEALQNMPFGGEDKIDRLRELADEISEVIDKDDRGEFREMLHNHPSPDNVDYIRERLAKARGHAPRRIIAKMEEALQLAEEIYNGRLPITELKKILGANVLEGLKWPSSDAPSLKEISGLSVSLRSYWDGHKRTAMWAFEVIDLARLGIALQKHAYAMCAVDEREVGTRAQAEKMGALIAVLYGSGYGDRGWLKVAERFNKLEKDWDRITEPERRLKIYSALAAKMTKDVQASYHKNYGPAIEVSGEKFGITTAHEAGSFLSELYRSMAAYQLAEHVRTLGVREGAQAGAVLKLLANEAKEDTAFRAYHYSSAAMPADARVVGGKGAGLGFLAKATPEHAVKGFALPPRRAGHKLDAAEKSIIRNAVRKLEKDAGKRLGDGLIVSVRSGAAISMPGTMETKLNVRTLNDIYSATEDIYASWDSEAARAYRLQNGIPDDFGTAVNVVEMVNAVRNENSGSGIAVMGKSLSVRYGIRVWGEELVSGRHAGKDPLPAGIRKQLEEHIRKFEEMRHEPVEVEFVVGSGKLKFLQIRRAHLTRTEEIAWFAKEVRKGRIGRKEALQQLGGREALEREKETTVLKLTGNEVVVGSVESSEGKPVSGAMAFSAKRVSEIAQGGGIAVFVTDDPDAANSAAAAVQAGAIILTGGNDLSHLSAIAKSMNLTMVRGDIAIERKKGTVSFQGGIKVREGGKITIDPASGKIYKGGVKTQTGPSPVTDKIDYLSGK